MKIDTYTKFILTIIAVALWVLVFKAYFITNNVQAANEIIDVNIKQIDGKRVYKVLDVNIEKVNGKNLNKSSIPVVLTH